WRELGATRRGGDGERQLAGAFVLGGERCRGADGQCAQSCALRLEPALEPGGIGDVEPVEQIAPVSVERAREVTAIEIALQRTRIGLEERRIHADLVVATRADRARVQMAAKQVQGGTQRGAR